MIEGFRPFHRTLGACLVGLVLSGCDSNDVTSSSVQLIGETLADRISPKDSETQGRDLSELTRAAISGVAAPFALAEIPKIDAAATVSVAATKGSAVTWVGGGAVTMTFIGPVLFSTRGVGPDLLTAETAPLTSLLNANRNGSLQRSLRHLDTQGRIVITDLTCSVTALGSTSIEILERNHQTRKFSEDCTGPDGLSLANVYWLGSDGTPWQSRQWISEEAGYLDFQRLVR